MPTEPPPQRCDGCGKHFNELLHHDCPEQFTPGEPVGVSSGLVPNEWEWPGYWVAVSRKEGKCWVEAGQGNAYEVFVNRVRKREAYEQ